MVTLLVQSCPASCTDLALANILPVNPNDFRLINCDHVELMGLVYMIKPSPNMEVRLLRKGGKGEGERGRREENEIIILLAARRGGV